MSEEILDQGQAQVTPPVQGNKTLPSSGGILAMGILSIPLAGGVGPILGIIALSISGSAERKYRANPELYREGSYKNMKAGKVCSIIGLSLTVLVVILVIAANA